ncbi:MAG: nucleotidyltransferase domain-containing protein [Nanoarchaeota archaeon]
MEQMQLKKRQKLFDGLWKFLKKEGVEDIFLFGSFVKGKERPNDIDICLSMKENNESLTDEIALFVKKETGMVVHFTHTCFALMLSDRELWKSILHEGYSIRHKEFVAKLMGMEPFVLAEYSLKGTASQKQIFSHAMNGTGGRESFLKDIHAKRIGRGVMVVPNDYVENARSFLDTWKADYNFKRIYAESNIAGS